MGVEGVPTHEAWTTTDAATGRLARVPADDPLLRCRLGRADRASQPPGALAVRTRPPRSGSWEDWRHADASQNEGQSAAGGVGHGRGAGRCLGLGAGCSAGRGTRQDLPDQQAAATGRRLRAALRPRAAGGSAGRRPVTTAPLGPGTAASRPAWRLADLRGRSAGCVSSAAACLSPSGWDSCPQPAWRCCAGAWIGIARPDVKTRRPHSRDCQRQTLSSVGLTS